MFQFAEVTTIKDRNRIKDPTWLLPVSELRSCPTKFVFDTLCVSVLDQGHTPAACITIRRIENEGRNKLPLGSQARLGVIGRIVTGIRMKMFEIIRDKGVSTVAGELTESPAALCSLLISCMHNFSMNSLGVLSNWMNTINEESEDVTVSKHMAHAKDIAKLLGSSILRASI
jgi:hypothetical protein